MAQTVIGFFKDPADAQKALDRLESKGISRQHVDISSGQYLDGTADSEGRNTNKFTDMFNKLFGHDSDDAKRYSTVGQSNVTLVTVHAPSNDLAEEAADVLDDCGAIDVDEHGSQDSQMGSNDRMSTAGSFGSDMGSISRGEDNLEERSSMMGAGGTRRRSRIIDRTLGDDFRLGS